MKKIAILISLFTTILSARAQVANTAGTQAANAVTPPVAAAVGTALPRPPDLLELKESNHNFGKIPQGRPATYTFEIVNTGTTPMRLDNVHASCGCTTPD